MEIIRKKYQRRLNKLKALCEKQNKKANLLSNTRVLTFLLGLVITFFLYRYQAYSFSILAIAVTILAFVSLVVLHRRILRKFKFTNSLAVINEESIQRIEGNWKSFSDTGEDFSDENHNYANDLDIFGQSSLFQWINTAKTYIGRQKLKDFLAGPPENAEKIGKRQEAIKELAEQLTWRQRYIAKSQMVFEKVQDPTNLIKWANKSHQFYQRPIAKVIFRILPLITVSIIGLYFTIGIPFYVPILAVIFQAAILFLFGKEKFQALAIVHSYTKSLEAYKNMLEHFEKKSFKTEYLRDLQTRLKGLQKVNSFRQIERLEKIAESISNRDNAMFLLFNIVLLWDYQCMIALEEWKQKSGKSLEKWLDIIGEVEALASLAILYHDHPNWVTPEFKRDYPVLAAKEMGHPLLTKDRVHNDIQIDNASRVLLITGSNMSGKSTYLRTAGINLVLAYAGGPVCAEEFRCSIMSIYTCMRISDNLEKNISSFYAELLRVKMIVAATKEKEQVFFLLDEIFKGTNSQDRHLGAKILVTKLKNEGAIGMVSTHDLELGQLEYESGQGVKNYHFKEYYQNGAIRFDYKLQPGISTTRNALYLMKMVGIEKE